MESTCACVLGPWPWPRAFLSLASRVSVLGKAVLGLGLGFFLCPWPWPRALCPRLHLCKMCGSFGKTPRDWQTGVIIPIFKKGDRKQCTNYRGISLFSLPGKVYAKCLERKCREIVESKLEDGHCGFRPGRSTTDQIFTLKQIFEKSWEYGKDFFACFVDLEKAYDRVPRDKLGRFSRSMALMVNCCALLSHSTADPRFVFG